MNKAEPPAAVCRVAVPLSQPLFLVGRNSHGDWVVRDRKGQRGGLFVSRTAALKFAMFENGNRPQAVIMVPGTLELDFAANDAALNRMPTEAAAPRIRNAA